MVHCSWLEAHGSYLLAQGSWPREVCPEEPGPGGPRGNFIGLYALFDRRSFLTFQPEQVADRTAPQIIIDFALVGENFDFTEIKK